jgi:hypothetical protein
MMPVQSTPRSVAGQSGETGGRVVPFPRCEESHKTLRMLRMERGWSLLGVAKAMTACAIDEERKSLPGLDTLKRNWMRWEAGTVIPDGNRTEPFYRLIIARSFGVTPEDLFPRMQPRTSVAGVGDLRLELLTRREQVRHDITRPEEELSYLDAVLTAPIPDTAG